MAIKIKTDPEDRLPAFEVGGWAVDKHDYLRRFLGISTYARRKFLAAELSGASYIELFAGPGRLWNRDTEQFIDGSPLIAHAEVTRTQTVFTWMHLGDARQEFLNTLATRLERRGANNLRTYCGMSHETVDRILGEVNPNAINFAFLDPFNLDSLPFTIIKKFAQINKMDLLIHVSAMELQRKIEWYVSQPKTPLDNFAPGWREKVRNIKIDASARAKVFEHWLELIRAEGFKDAKIMPLVRGPSQTPMYWLVLVAKHDLATKFWDHVNRPKQDGFAF